MSDLERRTLQIGKTRTSMKLEPTFWKILEAEKPRRLALGTYVTKILASLPDTTNRSAALRKYLFERQTTLRNEAEGRLAELRALTSPLFFDALPFPAAIIAKEATIPPVIRCANQRFREMIKCADPVGSYLYCFFLYENSGGRNTNQLFDDFPEKSEGEIVLQYLQKGTSCRTKVRLCRDGTLFFIIFSERTGA